MKLRLITGVLFFIIFDSALFSFLSSNCSISSDNCVTLIAAVKKWVIIDDEQRKLNELNIIKKEAENIMLKKMVEEDLVKISITDGVLVIERMTTKEEYTSKLMKKALLKMFSRKKVKKIINAIKDERKNIIEYGIKRIDDSAIDN